MKTETMLKVVFVLGCLLSPTLAKPVGERILCSISIIPIFECCNINTGNEISNIQFLYFLQMDVTHKRLARSDTSSDSNSIEVSLLCALELNMKLT